MTWKYCRRMGLLLSMLLQHPSYFLHSEFWQLLQSKHSQMERRSPSGAGDPSALTKHKPPLEARFCPGKIACSWATHTTHNAQYRAAERNANSNTAPAGCRSSQAPDFTWCVCRGINVRASVSHREADLEESHEICLLFVLLVNPLTVEPPPWTGCGLNLIQLWNVQDYTLTVFMHLWIVNLLTLWNARTRLIIQHLLNFEPSLRTAHLSVYPRLIWQVNK